MNAQLTSVLSGLSSLAKQQDWTRTITITDTLLSPDPPFNIVVAASTDLKLSALQAWLAEIANDIPITTLSFATLASDASPVVAGKKILAVFICDHLIESDEMDILNQIFFSRPAESYLCCLLAQKRSKPNKI